MAQWGKFRVPICLGESYLEVPLQVYIVGGADGYHISGTDSVMIIDIAALGEPMPCLYDETSRAKWWTGYRAGNMANYPYAKYFLRDEPAPLTSL